MTTSAFNPHIAAEEIVGTILRLAYVQAHGSRDEQHFWENELFAQAAAFLADTDLTTHTLFCPRRDWDDLPCDGTQCGGWKLEAR